MEAAIAARLPGSTVTEELHRAVDELVAAAGADRGSIPESMPSCDCGRLPD